MSRSSCLCVTDPRFITCGFEQGWSGLLAYTAPIWGLSREPKNKKSACIAIFLRLGTVVGCLIADWDAKTQVIGCTVAPFRSEGTKKSPQSQKSCKEARIFVFRTAQIAVIGQIMRKTRETSSEGNGENRVKEERRQGRTLICVCPWQGRQSLDPCSKKPVSR